MHIIDKSIAGSNMFVYSRMPALTRILNMPNTHTHTHTTTHTHILVLMGLFRTRFDVRVENLWLARKTKAKQHGALNHTPPTSHTPRPHLSQTVQIV